MKKIFVIILAGFLALCGLTASAQTTVLSATMVLTNTPQVSETNTLNSSTVIWTNAAGGPTNFVVIGSSLAASAQNLYGVFTNIGVAGGAANSGRPDPTRSFYYPNATSFQLAFVGITGLTNVTGTLTNSAVSNWATTPSTAVFFSTNTIAGISAGLTPQGAVVITNSGATLSAAFTFFNTTDATTNFVVTPSLTTLQSSYVPGATWQIQKVDGGVNVLALHAGTGVGIYGPAIIGQNGLTNSYQLGPTVAIGSGAISFLWTNSLALHLTWDGGTNLIGW